MSRLIARHVAIACLLVAAPVLAPTVPVLADGYGSVDCRQDPSDPRCVIEVGTPAAPGSPGGTGTATCRDGLGVVVPCFVDGAGWFGGDGCYYQPATGSDLSAAEALGGVPTPPGRWYVGRCGYPPSPALTRFRIFGTAPGPQLLADQAVKALRLPAPTIRVNPASPAVQIVFVPTWVWLGADSWGQRTATASVPGMSVTATATPVTLVLSTGDGAVVTCAGAGMPWTAGGDAAGSSPSCGHTYTQAGVFALRATVTWNVSWAGGGETGTAPGLTTTATLLLRVDEQQVLNGSRTG